MADSAHRVPAGRWKGGAAGLFVAPYLLVFVAMLVVPLVLGLRLSLTRADLFGIQQFVGLGNFTRLASDPVFLQTVWNTFYFVLLTVPALTIAGLLLALALNNPGRWAAVLRAIFFASTVLSVTVVTLIWRLVLIPEGGLAALVSRALGQQAVAYLSEPALAMPAVAVTTIWWGIGLPMVLFLAALQQVPRELYEAASLDKATKLRALLSITLPSIRRTVALVICVEIVLQFQLFGQPYLMTGGGPNNTTRPIVLFIYEAGWKQWQLGYATAASQVLFGLIACVAMAQYYLSSRRGAR